MQTITIPTPPDFRFRATVLGHGWTELAPFALDVDGGLHRGSVSWVTGPDESLVAACSEPVPDLLLASRIIFQLDRDLSGLHELLRPEPRYAWVERTGAGRLVRAPTVWEDLVKTLLTTNTTWRATQGMVERVVALSPEGRSFPTPEELASLDPTELDARVRAGYRSAHLHRLATDIAEGRVDPERWSEPGVDVFAEVSQLRGFGPYAAGTVAKLLGDFSRLALDSALRSMFSTQFREGGAASDAEIERHYAGFGEWRGLVMWLDLMRTWLPDSAPDPRSAAD